MVGVRGIVRTETPLVLLLSLFFNSLFFATFATGVGGGGAFGSGGGSGILGVDMHIINSHWLIYFLIESQAGA
tara:strand:+ start:885 stop:1103 length:219 start_codon:yes stop_codon:yes gene_type:complete